MSLNYIELGIEKIEQDNWEEAYELLEWASILEPSNPAPYLLKTVILHKMYWKQKSLYEEKSGRKFSSYLD